MRRASRLIQALLIGVMVTWVAGHAAASSGDAVASYKKGRQLIEQHRYQEALVELEKSNAEMPSPNTLLLIAHANRELGRLPRAAELYERVIDDAEAKVKQGEGRFQLTVNDARSWLDKISKELGWVALQVSGASSEAVVRVQDTVVSPRSSDGGVLKFDKLWVMPGQVVVTADLPGRVQRRVTVDVPKGGPASVVIDLSSAPAPGPQEPAPPPVPRQGQGEPNDTKRSVPTASWVAGGVGALGLATFAVFGSMARSKASQLDECSPRCPESERSTADDGKRDQAFANVGLVVGGIGLASAVGFYVWQPKGEAEQVGVAIAPGSVTVAGTF